MVRLRITPLLLLLAANTAVSLSAHAQTHKVTNTASTTRAVGVYEWTGDLKKPTAARLVPVSIFIDGHLEEAAVYLAQPVPFALDTGFAYSLDQAGISQGMLDLDNAAHLSSGNETLDNPWIGFGHFAPLAAPAKAAALRTVANPPAITSNNADLNDNRPRLVNKSPDSSSAPARPSPDPSTVGTGAKPSSTDSSSTSSSKDPENDVDRPTLRRPPPPTKDQVKQQKKDDKKANQASVTAPDRSLNDDPDRPTLRRKSSEQGNGSGTAELLNLPAGMHQLIAVSDAANRPEHNFARAWADDNEHIAILQQMQTIARDQLATYEKLNPLPAGSDTTSVHAEGTISTPTPKNVAVADNGPPTLKRGIPQKATPSTTATSNSTTAQTPATPAATAKTATAPKAATSARSTAASRRKAAATPPPPPPPTPLLDEDLRGFELSYGADPTFVYTAHTAGAGVAQRFVTLIAAQDQNTHELKLVLHSVTDATHRDRTPEIRVVDAVDVEASNRASLLLELRNQNSRQFALDRVISGRADQVFVSGTTR